MYRIVRHRASTVMCVAWLVLAAACMDDPSSQLEADIGAVGNDASGESDTSTRPDASTDPDTSTDLDTSTQPDASTEVDTSTDADPSAGPAAQIDEFTVNGQDAAVTIFRGDSLDVAWTSSYADECVAGGDFPGWNGTRADGGAEALVTELSWAADTFTLTLECSGAGGASAVEQRTVEVRDHCESRPAPQGWTQRTHCIFREPPQYGLDTDKDCRFFDQVWPVDWPGTTNTRIFFLEASEYVAIEFNTGPIAADTQTHLNVNLPQYGDIEPAPKLWSISTCPGDFHQTAVDQEMGPGCYRKDHGGGGRDNYQWGGSDSRSSPHFCALEAHRRYYLNILYTSSDEGTDPDAIEPLCEEGSGSGGSVGAFYGCGNRLAPMVP